jgi:hypothetical protein
VGAIHVELVQRQDYDFFSNVLTPFLRANSYLPQQATLNAFMPGNPGARPFVIELEIKDVRSYEEMVAKDEFHNILTQKTWIQFDILTVLEEADVLLDQMIARVESNL